MKGTKKLKESIGGIYEPRIIMSQINEEKSCFLPQFFVVSWFYEIFIPIVCEILLNFYSLMYLQFLLVFGIPHFY